MSNFRKELTALINRHSMEKASNTPDLILANYMADCLEAFDKAIQAREEFYGYKFQPGFGDDVIRKITENE